MEVDKKTKGKIINSLRRLTYSYPPRNEAKKRRKVDKALFQCEKCATLCYEGTSIKTFDIYKKKYYTHIIVMESPHVDHINPVIPIVKGWKWSWDDFINNLFCNSDNLQLICKTCHSKKTEIEFQKRQQLKTRNKN